MYLTGGQSGSPNGTERMHERTAVDLNTEIWRLNELPAASDLSIMSTISCATKRDLEGN